jgi:hypothetical protein
MYTWAFQLILLKKIMCNSFVVEKISGQQQIASQMASNI